LAKLLGGKETSACGGAAGVERIIKLMKNLEMKFPKEAEAQVFLTQLGVLAKKKSLRLLEDFRRAKIKTTEAFGRDSLKAQLNKANRLGVKYVLILGQKEALEGTIIIKNMGSGKQEIVKLDKVVGTMKKRLKKLKSEA